VVVLEKSIVQDAARGQMHTRIRFALCLLGCSLMLFIGLTTLNLSSPASAHGGGLDSDGGHNCYVGSCSGTYHCHQARGPGCGGGLQSRAPATTPSLAYCVSLSRSSMTRGEVQLLQLLLKSDGFSPGPLDGYFGRRTSIAVNAYELYYGLGFSPYLKIYHSTLKHMDVDC
jgi:hypothetical protein